MPKHTQSPTLTRQLIRLNQASQACLTLAETLPEISLRDLHPSQKQGFLTALENLHGTIHQIKQTAN